MELKSFEANKEGNGSLEDYSKRQKGEKLIRRFSFQNYLIIYIVRYREDNKPLDTTKIIIENEIDLEGLEHPMTQINPSAKYSLYATYNYEGKVNSGHYYAYTKSPEDFLWYRIRYLLSL